MTALVDTCVIIDALANREPFSQDAQELLLRGSEGSITLLVSTKTFLDIHYLLKHFLHEESLVRAKLVDLLSAVTLVDTRGTSCAIALSSPTTDYEDAVQIETALSEGADCIITRDTSGFSHSLIPAMGAKQFLSRLDGGESF